VNSKGSRNVEVGLTDLRVLVEMMRDKDIQKLAEVMVLTEPENSNPTAQAIFQQLLDAAMPKARQKVERDYRRLLEALESGVGVDLALKAFLRRD
jgi:hypothetical protein